MNINTSIQQNNSWYTFGSVAKEPASAEGKKQSGYAYTAFYFTRDNNVANPSTKTLYDVLLSRNNAAIDITGLTIKDLGSETTTTDNTLVKDSGLYWYRKTITRSDSLNTFTVSNTTGIRVNALVKIGGALYLITDVNGSSVTINGSPEKKYNVGYIAIAGIIDNTTPEGSGTNIQSDGYYEKPSRDDGDRMIESVDKSGTSWTWSASICSRNISDGPVTLHYVVFDNAGNCYEATVNGTITNNAPRIAGLVIKSDYNDDGDVEDAGETLNNYSIMFNSAYRSYYTGTTEETTDPTLNQLIFDPDKKVVNTNSKYEIPVSQEWGDATSPVAVLRGKTVLEPQIVGGNGEIFYGYKVINGATTKTANNTSSAFINNGSTDYTVVTGSIDIQLGDLLSFNDSTNANTGVPFEFIFWDSTEGTKPFDANNPSQKADLKIYMAIQAKQVGTPEVYIEPFYWNSSTDNSLYEGKTSNGHIELEKDWTAVDAQSNKLTAWDGKTDGTTQYDSDPKVSGKITIKGTAHDDKLIESISANIFGTTKKVAEYDATELKSNYEGDDFGTNHFWFEIDSQTINSNGHDVAWKLHIDTEAMLTEKAKANVSVTVTAKNFGEPTVATLASTATEYLLSIDGTTKYAKTPGYKDNSQKTNTNTTTQTGATQTALYRMDVVPYVTTIKTKLSDLKKGNPSVYARTSLGHYSVASGETIKIDGFNLSNSEVHFTKDTETVSVNYASEGVAIPADATSGNLKIVNITTSVESLNNANNNDGKGSYAGTVNLSENPTGVKSIYDNYYNRQPNGDNNNLLTDDVVMDVWEIDPQAVKPKAGTATQPVMAINPVNNQIGFAFVNGSLYFSMAAGTPGANNTTATTPNSYEYWVGGIDFWTSVGFAYDQKGHSFSTVAGGDINSGKADMFRIFTSYWGKGWLHNNGYRNGQNQFRLELVGQKDFEGSGTSYAAFDNFNKERIKSPSITTVSTSDNTTTVYLAYYDEINDEIRFKWGNFGDERKKPSALFIDYYGEHHNDKSGTNDTGWDNSGYDSVIGNKNLKEYTLDYISLIAGHTENRVTATNGTKVSKIVKSKSNKDVYAGKYVSIVALPSQGDSDDAVIAVWWDGTNNQMLYSYNLTPQSITAGSYTHTQTGWSEPEAIFGEGNGIGEYCKVVADKNNHIHIACYDGLNGDLYYAYVDDFTKPEEAKTCIVDSYGIIGTEINIDVGLKAVLDAEGNPVLENGNPKYITIPYISYYAGSSARPKIASWAGENNISTASYLLGADEEIFTGCWDISLIPTESRVLNDHINVGLWKDNGVIKESEAGTKTHVPGMGHTNSTGTVWGNGTDNPVLGYAITKGAGGFIETAQMK